MSDTAAPARPRATARVQRPSDLWLLWEQTRHQNRVFWRTPIAAFFSLVFPLIFLVLFVLIFGNEPVDFQGRQLRTAQFFTPALAVFGIATATYSNLAIFTSIARDEGILKRIRGTPLPSRIYLSGRILSATYTAFLSALLLVVVGVVFFEVELTWSYLPQAVLIFVVGVATFAALGLAVAAVVPSGESAPAVTNGTLLPVAFVSDVFIVLPEDAPTWLQTVGDVFPLKHFNHALGNAFNLGELDWSAVAVMAAWGLGGAVFAARYFRWEPKTGGERRRGSRAPTQDVATPEG